MLRRTRRFVGMQALRENGVMRSLGYRHRRVTCAEALDRKMPMLPGSAADAACPVRGNPIGKADDQQGGP